MAIVDDSEGDRRLDGDTFSLLFVQNPLPMWIYDLETLSFLEVNDAAVAQYGYTNEEFLRMRIMDIRPSEDVSRLLTNLQQPRSALEHTGGWRHRLRDGTTIDVEVTSHTLKFCGRSAALVVAHNVTAIRQATAALDTQRMRVFRATMTTVHDIVNNSLTGLQLIHMEAEGRLSPATLAQFDQIIQDMAAKLKALSDLQTLHEKEMAIGTGIDYAERADGR